MFSSRLDSKPGLRKNTRLLVSYALDDEHATFVKPRQLLSKWSPETHPCNTSSSFYQGSSALSFFHQLIGNLLSAARHLGHAQFSSNE